MKNIATFFIIFLLSGINVYAQVGINTDNSIPDSSAGLDVKFNNKGFLPPRMTFTEMNSIVNPAPGLMVYCTDCGPNGSGTMAMFTNGMWFIFNANCLSPASPLTGIHIPSSNQIVWNWNKVSWATGYKWNTINDATGAIDLGPSTSKIEPGLSCNTPYMRYIWAYNDCGNSPVTALTQTTSLDPPVAPTGADHIANSVQITWNWNASYGATGYKWNTINDADGATDLGPSTSKIETGLICNTEYTRFIWAYNVCGISPSTALVTLTFACSDSITTAAATNITRTTAISGGNIPAGGGSTVIARGVCWSLNPNPTMANNYTTDGSGTGEFVSSLTNLTPNTLYYIRAFAFSTDGAIYGNETTFVTLPTVTTTVVTSITQTSATSGGNVAVDGGIQVIARGVCWSTGENPTLADPHTIDASGFGVFISNITGLNGNTNYYVRAYATNVTGTSFGNQLTFMTSPILATVTTDSVFYITLTTAKSESNVTYNGGANITERGVCWSTSANPTIADSKTVDGTGTGMFESNLTSLTLNTLYYLRAYATNIAGTAYGNDKIFTTLLNPIKPTVKTTSITSITSTTATIGGNVLSDGGAVVLLRGVCWDTDPNPTITNSHTTDGNGTGIFTSNLTNLLPDTIYYVRAYAINDVGITYGNEVILYNTYYIGHNFGGGIIFYIDGTGHHGLIAAPYDQGWLQWGCYETFIGGTSGAIGTGQANTTLIVNSCPEAGRAARVCNDLTLNGYDDWFLPSKEELNQIYQNANVIGIVQPAGYWSSSQYNVSTSWLQRLDGGEQFPNSKGDRCYVRAVRAF